jgi:hypothetical protein
MGQLTRFKSLITFSGGLVSGGLLAVSLLFAVQSPPVSAISGSAAPLAVPSENKGVGLTEEANRPVIEIGNHQPAPKQVLGTLFVLLLVVALLIVCRTFYPTQMTSMFGIPSELDSITATEWMLFRLLLLISFLWALYEVLRLKIGL